LGYAELRAGDTDEAHVHFAKQVAALEEPCHDGDADACNELARAYNLGRGVEKDKKKSWEYRERAYELYDLMLDDLSR
jgi:TPR repeat protein